MRMPCRPRQHGAGHAEIIVLPWRASVDYSGVTQLSLKSHKLLISASAHRPINNSDLFGLQFVRPPLSSASILNAPWCGHNKTAAAIEALRCDNARHLARRPAIRWENRFAGKIAR